MACRPTSISLLLTCLFAYGYLFPQPVLGIYPDQAGKYDWLKQHVGEIELARFDGSRAYVATDLGVLASLDLEDGSIVWRAVLDEESTPIVDMVVSKGVLVMVDRVGVVRAWTTRGVYLWDAGLPTRARGLTVSTDSGVSMVMAVCDDRAVAYTLKNGTKLWETSLVVGSSASNRPSVQAGGAVKFTSTQSVLIPLFHRGSNKLSTLHLSLEDGSISNERQFVADTPSGTPLEPYSFRFLANQDSGVLLTEDGRTICAFSLSVQSTATKIRCSKVHSFSKDQGTDHAEKATMLEDQQTCNNDAILLRAGQATFLALTAIHNGDSVELKRLASISGHDVAALRCYKGRTEIVVGQSSLRGIDVLVKQIENEGTDAEMSTHFILEPLLIRTVDPNAKAPRVRTLFPSGPGHQGVLMQLEEATLLYVDKLTPVGPGAGAASGIAKISAQNERTSKWVRTEALANVQNIIFSDLPVDLPELQESNKIHHKRKESDFFLSPQRLQNQFLALKAQLGLATPEEVDTVERLRIQNSDKLRATRDLYGSRKQIIVATRAGKVISLHSGDGRVLWSLNLPNGHAVFKLGPWEVSHEKGSSRDRIVVFSRPKKSDGTSNAGALTATIICTKTGLVVDQVDVETSELDGDLEVVHLPDPIHIADHTIQHAFLIVSSAHPASAHEHYATGMNRTGATATLVPNTPEVRGALASISHNLVHWRVTADRKKVQGIRFDSISKAQGTIGGGLQFRGKVVWEVVAPQGNTVLAATGPDPTESRSLAARPLPNGDILLKRDNSNSILVLIGRESKATDQEKSRTELTASLVDAASGRILFSQQHEDATGPVHAVMSDQWAVYHYWNAAIDRWQMASIDAYHLPPPDLSVMTLAMSGGGGWTFKAGNDTSVPLFERQVFHMKLPARVLAVTKTFHGTAAKMVLVGTPGGQVYQVDRRLLDPRRPRVPTGSKPTPAQVAEGLPPYAPEVAIVGPSYVTMDKRVARLTQVQCSPTQLESSTLCVAVGLDMFYSRLQPSRGFDMVPDDFPHALLVAMVAFMTVALVAVRETTRRRALKLKWQ